MKKFNLSLVAVLAMSTFAVAGGDIAPVEEPVVVVPEVVETGNFYLGLAYSYIDASVDYTDDLYRPFDSKNSLDYNSIMVQAGYKFNDYVAVEGRYFATISDGEIEINDVDFGEVDGVDFDAWGLYVKPMYPVTDAFDIYALLGVANTNLNYNDPLAQVSRKVDETTFSWGLGASYEFDAVAVFVDYTSLYNDDTTDANGKYDTTVDAWSFGVTYNF